MKELKWTERLIMQGLVTLLIIVLVTVLIETENQNENTYFRGLQDGLASGFDQGFISGRQYQHGLDDFTNNITTSSINITGYYLAGWDQDNRGLNPYLSKEARR